MAETGIRFITFGISPYCEKARWALDWHRIRLSRDRLAPGSPPNPGETLRRQVERSPDPP